MILLLLALGMMVLDVVQVKLIEGKDSSENKGYAFVTYRTKELVMKATEDLHNTECKVGQLFLIYRILSLHTYVFALF